MPNENWGWWGNFPLRQLLKHSSWRCDKIGWLNRSHLKQIHGFFLKATKLLSVYVKNGLKFKQFPKQPPTLKTPMQKNWEKNGIFLVTTLFFWKFCFSLRTSYKELIWLPATQMSIFIVLVSAEVLFEDAFSLQVSLNWLHYIVMKFHKYVSTKRLNDWNPGFPNRME